MELQTREIKFVVLGSPGAGKTSFLSALLHGGDYARAAGRGVEWDVDSNPATDKYLKSAWDAIRNGDPVSPTDPMAKPTELILDLIRYKSKGDGKHATHRLRLQTVDIAGGFWSVADLRSSKTWEDAIGVAIDSADVLFVLIDALELDKKPEQRGQEQNELLRSVLRDARASGGETRRQSPKLLAVVFSKCDTHVRSAASGYADLKEVTRRLWSRLWPEETQKRIRARFSDVGFFGVYLLGQDWRWSRTGACVKVGDAPISPVGLFDAFEWVANHPSQQSKRPNRFPRAMVATVLTSIGLALAYAVNAERGVAPPPKDPLPLPALNSSPKPTPPVEVASQPSAAPPDARDPSAVVPIAEPRSARTPQIPNLAVVRPVTTARPGERMDSVRAESVPQSSGQVTGRGATGQAEPSRGTGGLSFSTLPAPPEALVRLIVTQWRRLVSGVSHPAFRAFVEEKEPDEALISTEQPIVKGTSGLMVMSVRFKWVLFSGQRRNETARFFVSATDRNGVWLVTGVTLERKFW